MVFSGRREEPNPGTRPQPNRACPRPARRRQAPRHDHPVRGAQPARWQGHRHCMKRHRHKFIRFLNRIDRHPALSGHSPDHRQLRQARVDAGGQTVAEKTPALPHPFHPDIGGSWLTDGRALLRGARKRIRRGVFASPSWSRPSTTISHPQSQPGSLRLDRNRHRHSRKNRPRQATAKARVGPLARRAMRRRRRNRMLIRHRLQPDKRK